MGWDSASEHSSDDEEQSTDTTTFVLIAIDCDNLMFQSDDNNEESSFKIVLQSCYNVMDHLLMKGGRRGKTPIAITMVSDDVDNMIICDFKDHLPSSMKKFRELCEMTNEELRLKYKRDDTFQLSNFFLNCKRKLGECGPENPKYIAYICKNDNPIGDDDDERRLCVNHAKTFKEFNIYLELLIFNPLFDYDIFFKELLDVANCKFNYQYFTDTIGLTEKLLSMLVYRGNRALFYPFNNHGNFFEVIEKRYIKHTKFCNNISVTKDTNDEVKEIKRGGEFKDTYTLNYSVLKDPLTFTSEEREILVYDGIPVGYSLIGTSKENMVDTGLNSSDPRFIQRNRQGNCPHFDIFWHYCVDKNCHLICTRKYKKDGPTKLVQATPKVVNGVRSFLILGIPYFNDIHYQDLHNPLYQAKPTNSTDVMEAAENFVNTLDFVYDPSEIHDTVNCRKWEYVRAELLEEKARPVSDILDLNVIEKDVTDVVNAFEEQTRITVVKRKATSSAKGRKKK